MFKSLVISLFTFMLAAVVRAQDGKIDFQILPLPGNLVLSEDRANFVIRSAQDWNAWIDNSSEVTGAEPIPAIDFERYTLLVSNAGSKARGPVVVKFDSIIDTGSEVRVHVSISSPESCPRAPESGRNAAMALIPHTDKPIQFDVSNVTSGIICPSKDAAEYDSGWRAVPKIPDPRLYASDVG
jgi:hypothetical protein